MRLDFIKMHAAGNDYIYFDCLGAPLNAPEEIAKQICKRHFSVGADGIVLICPSKIADARMRIFNADGSEAKMCGNAARCVGKLLYNNNFIKKSRIMLETESGVRELFLTIKNKRVEKITVDMGNARFDDMFFLDVCGQKYEMRGISIGNEHQVTFLPDVDFLDLGKIGGSFEKNPRYADGVNTEFCEIVAKNHLKVRTFERGSGETLACGTGACAAAVAAILCGSCETGKLIRVSMRGGDLFVTCDENYRLRLMGDAKVAFLGTLELEI